LENVEETYEKKPRLAAEAWKPDEHVRLPLKDKTGVIQQSYNHVENGKLSNKFFAVRGMHVSQCSFKVLVKMFEHLRG
jgi:hypothetical protein